MSASRPAGFAEFAQNVSVVIRQLRAGLGLERFPIAVFRDFRAALIGHLEEQQIRQMSNIVTVVHAVVTQRVAEAPEFLDDVAHSVDGGGLMVDSRKPGAESPAGTSDNSPAIHRWDNGRQTRPSPAGAKEINANPFPHIPGRAFLRNASTSSLNVIFRWVRPGPECILSCPRRRRCRC